LRITEDNISQAVFGGCILGGGGGGKIENGLEMGKLAFSYGSIDLEPIEHFKDDDIVITASAVGAPSAKEKFIKPDYYIDAVKNLIKSQAVKPAGIITNENGAIGTVNGWLQAAALGIPVLDAPADGRAHPTAIMGSMGLFMDKNYMSCQSAIGGDPLKGKYVELVVRGNYEKAANIVRRASIEAGGTVVVARDPVSISFLKGRAAIGAISQAINIGKVYLNSKAKGAEYCVKSVCDYIGGKVLGRGVVEAMSLNMKGGFDVGEMTVRCDNKKSYNVFFWNEYMGVEAEEERLATFPDLIMTFSGKDGYPVVSAEIKEGMDIYLVVVGKENIKLGYGMKLIEAYKVIEEATGREIIKYISFS
jgi:hypothetical protein